MSSPPPHFLSLPREIRNIIYNDLNHNIDLDWGYKILPFPLGGHYAIRLRLQNAPLPSVLLSCTQLYDEYSQSCYLKKCSVTIKVGEHYVGRLLENEPTNQARAFEILRGVRHIDFQIDSADRSGPDAIWTTIDELSQAISVLAPQLETIRVIAQSSCHKSAENVLSSNDTYVVPVGPSPPVLGGHLLLYGRQAFWNQDSDSQNLFHGRDASTGPGSAMAGEWHFVRGKGNQLIGAN